MVLYVEKPAHIPTHLHDYLPTASFRVEKFRVGNADHRCAETQGMEIALHKYDDPAVNRDHAFTVGANLGRDWNDLHVDGKKEGYYPHVIARVTTRGFAETMGVNAGFLLANVIAGIDSTAHLDDAHFPTRFASALKVGVTGLTGAAAGAGLALACGLPLFWSTAIGQVGVSLGAWYSVGREFEHSHAQIMRGASLLLIVDEIPLFGIRREPMILNVDDDDGHETVIRSPTAVATYGVLNLEHGELAQSLTHSVWSGDPSLKPSYPLRETYLSTSGTSIDQRLAQLGALESAALEVPRR